MAGLQTGIELQDNFTTVLYGIINSVNIAVGTMYDMQQAMNADVDTSSFESIRNEISQAEIAMNELNAAFADTQPPDIDIPADFTSAAPSGTTPEPVSVPIQWQTDDLQVFTNTGIERFQQEVQSTNTMLGNLNRTQARIGQTAEQLDFLPDGAVQDINMIGQRMQVLQRQIQTISDNPVNMGTDEANAQLERLRSMLNEATVAQNQLNEAMFNMDPGGVNDAYMRLSQTISTTERYIRDNADEQGRFNGQIRDGTEQANGLVKIIRNAAAAYLSVQGVGKVLSISDNLTQTTARLDIMNDNLQTTEELVNMVYAAAQDARGSFSEMSRVVARFGNNAKDAFGSSEEVVAFADLIQKQMTIAGASTQESANAMLQLSQALGSGVLRGDELNSVFENAPNIIRSIADYLNVPIGEIRDMAAEGELSAGVVKAAVFTASDEINSKFESMPVTWQQVWQSMQNTAIIAFRPVLQKINELANSESFQTFADNAVNVFAILATAVLDVFELIGEIGSFISENWSLIEPVIMAVVFAMGLYTIALAANAVMNGVQAAAMGISTIATNVHTAAIARQSGMTFRAMVNQYGLNAALMACPITWIIVGIIAVIAVICLVCNYISKVTGVAISGMAIILGALSVTGALIINTVIGLLNGIIQLLWTIFIEPFIGIIEWVLNVANGGFNDFGGMVANLIGQIISWFLSLGKVVTKIIDAIFGTDWTSGLNSLQDEVVAWGKNEDAITLDRDAPEITYRMDYDDAWDNGVKMGEEIDELIGNFSLDNIGGNKIPDPNDYLPSMDYTDMNDNLENISDDTGDISDAMDITEEDLKYLRDIAEQEAVNRFTTAEITIEQTNHNNISSDMDLDGIISGITDATSEAAEIATEGVHK